MQLVSDDTAVKFVLVEAVTLKVCEMVAVTLVNASDERAQRHCLLPVLPVPVRRLRRSLPEDPGIDGAGVGGRLNRDGSAVHASGLAGSVDGQGHLISAGCGRDPGRGAGAPAVIGGLHGGRGVIATYDRDGLSWRRTHPEVALNSGRGRNP